MGEGRDTLVLDALAVSCETIDHASSTGRSIGSTRSIAHEQSFLLMSGEGWRKMFFPILSTTLYAFSGEFLSPSTPTAFVWVSNDPKRSPHNLQFSQFGYINVRLRPILRAFRSYVDMVFLSIRAAVAFELVFNYLVYFPKTPSTFPKNTYLLLDFNFKFVPSSIGRCN